MLRVGQIFSLRDFFDVQKSTPCAGLSCIVRPLFFCGLNGIVPLIHVNVKNRFPDDRIVANKAYWPESLICGTPTVLIRGGKLQQDAMRKNRFTIDELMEELREQGVTRIEDVKYAVLENSGQLTVFPWTAQQPPTAEQLGLGLEDDVTLPMVIINDGRVIHRNLTACGRDENWLRKQLSREKASSPREIFLLTLDEQGQVFCVRKERES